MSTSTAKSGERASSEQYGPAFLRLEFGRATISKKGESFDIEPQQIEEMSITLDINRFLPAFKLKLYDSAGFFTHLVPFDRDLARLHVQIASATTLGLENTTDFSFDVYRRFPRSDMIYDIEGMHVVNNLFSPDKTRGFDGTIKSTLETIGTELGVDSNEVSISLNYEKNLIQPGWSNAKFLSYLKQNVRGQSYEAAFYTFIKCTNTDCVFVFKTIKDFVGQVPKYNFCLCASMFEDRTSGEIYYPILEYRIIDNYKLIGTLGARRQECLYFNYTTGALAHSYFNIDGNSNPLTDYHSFTDYHLIDNADDARDNISMLETGRSNDFTSDFSGKTLNAFHKNITDLTKIWIDTVGIENIYPGDIVNIEFLEHEFTDNKYGYQHQGFWMVERVVHLIGKGFITRLLLTRNGSDSSGNHNLLKAGHKKVR